jgi:hypothetical protein
MPRARTFLGLLSASILVFLAGCSQQGSVVGPERAQTVVPSGLTDGQQRAPGVPGPPSALYSSIWPHEDGTGWSYRVTGRSWDQPPPVFYSSPEDVPVLTMKEAIRALRKDPTGPNPETSTGSYRLQFNGSVTTMSGVTRQNLEETLVPDVGVMPQPGPTSSGTQASVAIAQSAGPAFLQLLRRARPDLANKIGLRASSLATQSAAASLRPTLLHGYAWEQTDQWIGTYGDLNQQIAWIFLTPDLRPGSGFSLQLVPELANDVFLYAQVIGWRSVGTDAGTFPHALEVAYLVDFGVSQATDQDGDPLGYSRSYLYGTIDYVAGVGPVHSYERSQIPFDFVHPGIGDLTVSLDGTTAPAP